MTPYVNTIQALYQAKYETLAAIDTDGLYTCLETGCCGNDTQMFTNWFIMTDLIQYYQATGVLPVWDNICCNPSCGELDGVTPTVEPGESSTVALRNLAGTVVQGRLYYGSGTLAGGTLVIAAPWVTAATVINATYTTASAAGQANISRGTITPSTSFVINGEGTNTFSWTAFVPS